MQVNVCSVDQRVPRRTATEAGNATHCAYLTATLPSTVPCLFVQVCEELFTDITCPLDAAARAAMGVSGDGGGRLYYEVRHRTAAQEARGVPLTPHRISGKPVRIGSALECRGARARRSPDASTQTP